MKISNQLKDIMKYKNVSITELATVMDTSQPNLTGKLLRDNFKLSDIQEIANALGYTDMEIILRGSKEDAIIFKDKVEYKPHNVYMMLDSSKNLIQDIEENGFRDTKFKDIVFEIVEEKLKPLAGDMWEVNIPNVSKEIFVSMALALLLKMSITEEELESNANMLKQVLDYMKED